MRVFIILYNKNITIIKSMPTYFEIIAYLTVLFICYNIRVYISYLWHNKKDNNHKTETNDRNIALSCR
jgi:hypothetical protein